MYTGDSIIEGTFGVQSHWGFFSAFFKWFLYFFSIMYYSQNSVLLIQSILFYFYFAFIAIGWYRVDRKQSGREGDRNF